jgi:hypothetical protein
MKLAFPSTLTERLAYLVCFAFLAGPGIAGGAEPEPAAVPPSASSAEARAWSVSLGTGGGGFVEFVNAFSNAGPAAYDKSRRENRLQLNARADRELNRRFRAGVAVVYNRWTETYFSGGTRVGSIDNSVYVLMADITARWVRTEWLELYSGLAAGGGRWSQAGQGIGASQDGVQSGFAFQIRYFGANVGNDRFRAFVDLGLGFEGLVVGGLTLRF